MNWYIFAILASISWGIGQVFIKKGLKNMSPLFSNILAGAFAILIEVPFALWGGVQWKFFPQIFLFAILANLPNFIFPYVISKTDVSVGGTLLATYPIYTITLSLLFLHESLDGMQVMAIVAVVAGMYLVLKSDSKKIKLSEGILWALIGAILIGIGDFVGKLGISRSDLYSFILAFALANIPCILFVKMFDKSKIFVKKNSKGLSYSLIGNFLMPLGMLFLYIAFSKGPVSLASPIASTYPAITVILAYFYLKEKLNKNNIVGIILVTLGIISISF